MNRLAALAAAAGGVYLGFHWGRDTGEASMKRLSDRVYWGKHDALARECYFSAQARRQLRERLDVAEAEAHALRTRVSGLTSLSRVVAERVIDSVASVSSDEARALLRASALLEDLADARDV